MLPAYFAKEVAATAPEPVAWYFYAGFIVFVLAMLFVDLRLFHREAQAPNAKESGMWVAVWVSLALLFGAVLLWWKGVDPAIQYITGYLVEYSLSVDNMFVFLVIFSYFAVPKRYQHRVLFFGILGAMIFRGLFIAVGTALITRFDWVIYIFGGVLVLTAIRVARGAEDLDPADNPVLKLFRKRFRTSSTYHGQKLFTIDNGKRRFTPLFVVLLIIETTDIVFAVDSIPAIFGITRDPFIVLTSNVFAILGLRALYFLLARSMDRFHLLKYGLAIILGFVGVKMLTPASFLHGYVSERQEIFISLGFIVMVLAATALISTLVPPKLLEEELPHKQHEVEAEKQQHG